MKFSEFSGGHGRRWWSNERGRGGEWRERDGGDTGNREYRGGSDGSGGWRGRLARDR